MRSTETLLQLLAGIGARVVRGTDRVVSDVTLDSRAVKAGAAFFAARGLTAKSADGHQFIAQAIAAGAVAVVVEDEALAVAADVLVIVVPSARVACAVAVERLLASPSHALKVVGVTGTNGKTTTTWLLAQLLTQVGVDTAVFGTLGVGRLPHPRLTGFTTPEAETVSRALAGLRDDGVAAVAMEATSHALASARIEAVQWACTAFTNLTRDHLDFHGDMESYFQAKLRLLCELGRSVPCVVPAASDDEGYLARVRSLRPDALSYGTTPNAALRADEVRYSPRGTSGVVCFGDERLAFSTPLLGSYNLENTLCALGIALQLDVPLARAVAALASITAPPGRLETVAAQQAHAPSVVVDYAHTPDALQRALEAVRAVATGKVYVVFGCGGDRDAGKRPVMGAIAATHADASIITDDNPRSERGEDIAAAIAAGMTAVQKVEPQHLAPNTFAVERSRRFAIRAAIAKAGPDDVVLIAGKGHERTQTAQGVALPFSDVDEARAALDGIDTPSLLQRGALASALSDAMPASPAWVTEVSTDSRHLEKGALFVALVGDNFDGHAFVKTAVERGAAAAVVAKHAAAQVRASVGASFPLFVVDDTLAALQCLAKQHLLKQPAVRVAITGSNGKTTTKELVRAALSATCGAAYVMSTAGNLNNHIGLPLTALRVHERHHAAVLEMGMNHLGEIAALTELAQPHIGLVTNMGSAHAGNVGGIEGVAAAKAELWETMAKGDGGVAVVNVDDVRCVREATRVRAANAALRQVSYGTAKTADVRLLSVRDGESGGQDVEVRVGERAISMHVPLEGRHNAHNAVAALAVVHALKMDVGLAAQGIAALRPPPGRLTRRQATCGALLLDDSYNANPDSMRAGLTTLAELAGPRRRVAMLGEMRELGDLAPQAHREIGAFAAEQGVTLLLACGDVGRLYGEGAGAQGLPASAFVWAKDSAALAVHASSLLQANDVVLVKGSRGARMERVVSALTGQESAVGH